MIIGVGVDMIELNRIKRHLENDRFLSRILTNTEYHNYKQLKTVRQAEFLAGRFAAKEAYAKAKGTGIGKQLSWQDIEVIREQSGKPTIETEWVDEKIHLSITHNKSCATAFVVIEKTN